MTKRVSWVAWNSEIATLLLFGCLQTTNMFYRIAAWLLFVSLLVWDHQALCCPKRRLGHESCHWGPLKKPHETYERIVQDARNNKLTALTKSKKKFPLSVGLLMAYLQAESFSNSGRFFVTWTMHGVEIPLVWTNMKLYPYDTYMTFNFFLHLQLFSSFSHFCLTVGRCMRMRCTLTSASNFRHALCKHWPPWHQMMKMRRGKP